MATAIQTSKQPWVRRPSGLVRPDWNSWQANSLVAWFANWASGATTDVVAARVAAGTDVVVVGSELGSVPSFNGTSSYYLFSQAIVAAAPLTLVAWFRVNNTTSYHMLVNVGASGVADNIGLGAAGSRAGDPVTANARQGATTTFADGPAFLANSWTHGAAVFASSTSRVAYTNGIPGSLETTAATPTGINRTGIGVNTKITLSDYTNGYIADARIYNRALDAAEIEALYHPRTRWELYQG